MLLLHICVDVIILSVNVTSRFIESVFNDFWYSSYKSASLNTYFQLVCVWLIFSNYFILITNTEIAVSMLLDYFASDSDSNNAD